MPGITYYIVHSPWQKNTNTDNTNLVFRRPLSFSNSFGQSCGQLERWSVSSIASLAAIGIGIGIGSFAVIIAAIGIGIAIVATIGRGLAVNAIGSAV
jgi:hypothetical protein